MEIIVKIINYTYDDYTETVNIEFATDSDGDDFFRSQDMDKKTFLNHYPQIFDMRSFKDDVDEENLIHVLESFYEDSEWEDFPSQQLF